MAAKRTRDLTLSELRPGMCVIKMDISWFESPFFTHTRVIKDGDDIKALKEAGVKKLTIDLDKSNWKEDPPQPQSAQQTHTESAPAEPEPSAPKKPSAIEEPSAQEPAATPPPDFSAPEMESVAEREKSQQAQQRRSKEKTHLLAELEAASELRSEIQKTVEKLQQDLEQGKAIEAEALTPLIDDTVSSLARNNQALMSLVHLNRKSKKIADHAFGTFCLVLNLAMARDVSAHDRECLGLAALLHEVGWTQLPLNLIGKRTKYTDTERKLISQHTLIGSKILERSELPELTRRLIDEHHERMDGSGYPKKLTADQIHPLSQLLSVVDAYEEKIHQLTDRPGEIPTVALRSMYKEAQQGWYEQSVVASFISLMGIYPPTTAVLLGTGEKAVVVEVHADVPLLPTICIHYDKKGHPLREPIILDLRLDTDTGSGRQISRAIDPKSPGIDPLGCLAIQA